MGMGDQKPKFSPSHHKLYDPVSRQYFADCLMRKCPHEGVQSKYGKDCYVSLFVCKRCQYGKKHNLFSGWFCEYETNS